eukprot:2318609-Pyramimonas_sp.AAC.1
MPSARGQGIGFVEPCLINDASDDAKLHSIQLLEDIAEQCALPRSPRSLRGEKIHCAARPLSILFSGASGSLSSRRWTVWRVGPGT